MDECVIGLSLAFLCLAGCQGKGEAPPRAAAQQTEAPSPIDAAAADDGASHGAQDSKRARTHSGFIEAVIGGERKRFAFVSDENSHVVHGRPGSLILHAKTSEDSTEQFVISVRGHDLRRVIGQPLKSARGGNGKAPKMVSVIYFDPEHTQFMGVASTFELQVTGYKVGKSVEGTFGGTMKQRKGERELMVEEGRFLLEVLTSR